MLSVLESLVPGLATSAPAHVATAVHGITPGRAQSLAALAVGLISVVLGALALARSVGPVGRAGRRSRAIVSLAVGLSGMILSALRLATASGGIGTGSGRLGAIVALVAALVGTVLGGLAMSRSRRTS
jgi:hypothetical protein